MTATMTIRKSGQQLPVMTSVVGPKIINTIALKSHRGAWSPLQMLGVTFQMKGKFQETFIF